MKINSNSTNSISPSISKPVPKDQLAQWVVHAFNQPDPEIALAEKLRQEIKIPLTQTEAIGLSQKILFAVSLQTDMTTGTTTFDPRPEEPNGEPFTISTRNDVVSTAKEGSQDPYTSTDVHVLSDTNNHRAYGPAGAYINTGDSRGRDIHGGGSCLDEPEVDQQGWCPTLGCTRGQNADVIELGEKINEFKSNHPDVAIPYRRF